MYSELVKKIFMKPTLENDLRCMIAQRGGLNLVCDDWREQLNRYPAYMHHFSNNVRFSKGKHLHNNNLHVCHVVGMENTFNVTVAGYWSFDLTDEATKKNTIVCRNSEPLVEIAVVMAENGAQSLSENCRFFVETCIKDACSDCVRFKVCPRGEDDDWCIKTTRIFDGETSRYALKSHVIDAFGPSTFVGILSLKIYTRIKFGDNKYKIGGTCNDMILFKDSALNPGINAEKLYRPFPSDSGQTVPRITYVEERKDEIV